MADTAPSTATHNSPRTWLLTAALSPLAVRLIRQLLAHGDYVVACLPPLEIEHDERSAEFRALIAECKSGRKDREGWKDRIRGIRCDGRAMSACGSAIAEAVHVFGRVDILLCCKSEGERILFPCTWLAATAPSATDVTRAPMANQGADIKQPSSARSKSSPPRPLLRTSCASSLKPYSSPRSTSSRPCCRCSGNSTPATSSP